ncbi:Uncharacterized protein dnl_01130 [Desulfonema limicola]|uniref:Uncharacterized protein n=1 Tax=Desulfonema limicola TaxID=45656 RepID=A0A975B345_9BACT|nr:hypothetical protein [Desulfonema limicola]QTA77912.1 Uncharacterized protein dnl_01130 [Desulfonema limicola]
MIDANTISFYHSWITAYNWTDGKGADVSLKAEDSVTFAGGSLISLYNMGAGGGGNLLINAGTISFSGSGILETEIQNQDYGIVHLATHAVFGDRPEAPSS